MDEKEWKAKAFLYMGNPTLGARWGYRPKGPSLRAERSNPTLFGETMPFCHGQIGLWRKELASSSIRTPRNDLCVVAELVRRSQVTPKWAKPDRTRKVGQTFLSVLDRLESLSHQINGTLKGLQNVEEVFRPPWEEGIGEKKNGKLKFSAT